MKKIIIIFIAITLYSCNELSDGLDDNKRSKIKELTGLSLSLGIDEVYSNMDDESPDLLNSIGADYFILYTNNEYHYTNSDSVALVIWDSGNIFSPEVRILYDFAASPRNFGDTYLDLASYLRIQLDDRFYYEEESFD